MLDLIISKGIAAVALVLSSFLIIKSIIDEKKYEFSFKNIVLLIVFGSVTVFVHNTNYSPFASLIFFATMILVYKIIFNIELSKSILVVGIMFVLYFIADIIVWSILSIFCDSNLIRTNIWIIIISNFLVSALSILFSKITFIKTRLIAFVNKLDKNKYYDRIVFFVLVFIVLTLILYNISKASFLNVSYLVDVVIMIFFFVLAFIYINEKLQKDKLNTENDQLLEYVANFENWIEDAQLNNHEYKNQLVVIRTMAEKNPKIINYINDILKDEINTEDSWFNEIKYLPEGGIRGLLYYKLILTKKENINVCMSISRDVDKFISGIENNDLKNISRLLGIYLDNAIDASKQSDKKLISVEIYPINNNLNFVISNTYNGNIDLKKIKKKGYTTKGKGHGRGLYFASKLIRKSNNFVSENSIINDFYVQKLIIK